MLRISQFGTKLVFCSDIKNSNRQLTKLNITFYSGHIRYQKHLDQFLIPATIQYFLEVVNWGWSSQLTRTKAKQAESVRSDQISYADKPADSVKPNRFGRIHRTGGISMHPWVIHNSG